MIQCQDVLNRVASGFHLFHKSGWPTPQPALSERRGSSRSFMSGLVLVQTAPLLLDTKDRKTDASLKKVAYPSLLAPLGSFRAIALKDEEKI